MTESGTDDVIVERRGAAGIVRLNRRQALNALTLPMVRALRSAFDRFSTDDEVAFVLLEGEGERAFCAGGDIRAIHDSGKAGTDLAETFWREEYELNASIAEYSKPVVVFMDGIVMGGGAGLSIHASHRVATDRIRFAMPETGIGFVPDVGATHRLSRAPDGVGRYLALTGSIVGAADVIAAGLADVMVPAERLPELRADLLAAKNAAAIEDAIGRQSAGTTPGLFSQHRSLIARAFSAPDIEGVLEALEADGSEFAKETRATILSRSPSSLRDTEALLEHATNASLRDCLTAEFFAALGTLQRPDFYEGVRAAVIDKDRNPRWSPPLLSDAPPVDRNAFFARPGIVPPFASEASS